jgi:hypothetical protein
VVTLSEEDELSVGGGPAVMAMVCAAAQPGPPSLPLANAALKTPCSSVA